MKWMEAVAGLTLISVACSDSTPVRIEVASSNVTLLDVTPSAVGARLVNRAGQPLMEPGLTYSTLPTSVATAQADGTVTCHSSGSATVVVAGGGQSATYSVTCRIAETIDAPKSLRLILGRVPEPQSIVPRDREGAEVMGAPVRAHVSDPAVLEYSDGTFRPRAVGKAEVVLSSGNAEARVSVSVVELLKSEALAIEDGVSITLILQHGAYELDVKAAPSNGGKNGLVVDWLGADCPRAFEAQQHHLTCLVRETASLTIRNPSTLGLGPSLTGFVNLYRTAPSPR